MSTDEKSLEKRLKSLETDDVAQKRLEMYRIFEKALDQRLEEGEGLEGLEKVDGYMYKLSQEFLLSSSTMEKESTLKKILEHVK
ncbi:MAG: hypothetical protein ACLFRK_02505 [Candidatus Nanohaloarchaea archaeon]